MTLAVVEDEGDAWQGGDVCTIVEAHRGAGSGGALEDTVKGMKRVGENVCEVQGCWARRSGCFEDYAKRLLFR